VKRCLFINHKFHAKTRSSDFFYGILKSNFEIDVLGIDPQDLSSISQLIKVKIKNYDLIVLWQLDFLYVEMRRLTVPVVVVPMYDACGGFGDVHFRNLRGALAINFSLDLHLRCLAEGVTSIHWKYYPPITGDFDERRNSRCESALGNRVFFWYRNRQQTSLRDVWNLFPPNKVDSLHLHVALDDGSRLSGEERSLLSSYKDREVSEWFTSHNHYLAALSKCNIFVTPRRWEGIGFSMLEAAGLGLCVVAWDYPTHNEYIVNWKTGILFDSEHLDAVSLDAEVRKRIQLDALDAYELGLQVSTRISCSIVPEIMEFLDRTPIAMSAAERTRLWGGIRWRDYGQYATEANPVLVREPRKADERIGGIVLKQRELFLGYRDLVEEAEHFSRLCGLISAQENRDFFSEAILRILTKRAEKKATLPIIKSQLADSEVELIERLCAHV
jgi:hypothetical protein